MAIYDMQGLDDIADQADFGNKVTLLEIVGTATFNAGQGRVGGTSMSIASGSQLKTVAAYTDPYASVAFFLKVDALPSASTRIILIATNSSGSASASDSGINLEPDGSLWFFGSGSAVSSVSLFPAGSVTAGEYCYICFSTFVSQSGSVDIRLNNSVAHIEADTLRFSGSRYAFIFGFTGMQIDDPVITDDNTHFNYTPSIIEHKVSNLDRAQADFATLGAGAGYEEIDDLIHDGDTSYIYATTPGDASEFGLEDASAAATEIRAVKVSSVASREGTGVNGLEVSLRTSVGTEVTSVGQALVDGVYVKGDSGIVTINPDTGLPFTISEFNALYARCEVV